MKHPLAGALALAAAWLLAAACLAAEAPIGPQSSSDQIRAARPLDAAPALVFDVERTVKGEGPTPKVTHETVTLAPSFILVAGDQASTLDDRTLCRALSWSKAKPVLENASCYAAPAFKLLEMANRTYLAKIVKGDLYWDEVELGVQQEPSTPLERRENGAVAEYSRSGDVVVRIGQGAYPFVGGERELFVRYLALHTQLHPQVRGDLGQGPRLPSKIEFTTFNHRSVHGAETLVISNVRHAATAYPLPAGLPSRLSEDAAGDGPRARGIRAALEAIDGRSTIARPPSEPELVQQVHEAVLAKKPMAAALLFLELTQQYSRQLLSGSDAAGLAQLRQDLPLIRQDPDANQLLDASTLAGDPKAQGDREAAARYLASATALDALPFGTFRHVTFANLVRVSADSAKWDPAILKAMPQPLVDSYWTHIAAYPWASNAYKDAGDAYVEGYDMWDAWIAFDLGRAVDPDWRSAAMASVGELEGRLRTAAPDFF
jgi:hypothetical protein